MAAQTKPKLVIVGAGFAGLKLAKLAGATGVYDLTVIDSKDFFEINYAGVRAVVDPSLAEKTLIPYSSVSGIGKVIQGVVKVVKRNSVELENGDVIPFDYAAIATGSTHSGQGVVTSAAKDIVGRKAELKAIAEQIKNSKNIVIAGAGPVGIEIAGEIVEAYAGKSITLVSDTPQLLQGKPVKLHNTLLDALKQHKVEVVFGDRVESHDAAAKVATLKSGKQVPAEVVIWAAGSKPNAHVFAGGDLASSLGDTGRVRVDEYLRLSGAPHIFVLGDINDVPPPKLGYLADLQAKLTVGNLAQSVSGKGKFAKWAPPGGNAGAMFVSFGKGFGVGHLGGCICPAFMVKSMKSKDLFVSQVRKELGV